MIIHKSYTSLCCLLGLLLVQSNRENLGFLVTVYICYVKQNKQKNVTECFQWNVLVLDENSSCVTHKMLTVYSIKEFMNEGSGRRL